MSILKLENISYHYDRSKVMVLDKLNMDFDEGKIYTIVGKSGAGKTTLLSVLSSLAAPTDGKIFLNDKDITKIDRYKFRSKYVGVIFQSFNLLTHLTALENVILSMDISGKKFDRPKKEIALELLRKVGLDEEEAKRRVLKLSGGQQQRVAIARALSYDPDIILADEPTGNLDGETQDEIIGIFRMLAEEGKCVIIVTHSPDVAKASDITYELKKPDKAS
ncbi:MAG: ABC transporter ATP-binding protein [Ruminococcus sp.]|nr:ABC transporter ATP-binding protein [Ruminococcus sp.]